MLINSTGKMLASMAGKSKTKPDSADHPESPNNNYQTTPQLTPGSEMENVLNNILGADAAKKNSPMDK
ncbi:MAG: hypothetical protein EPN84_10310 [Legionella sp.]|nr:MAG: hypothetical protein EPN84_10310 [Legionella sp.]